MATAVLVVDASPLTVGRVRELLAGSGFQLHAAHDRAGAEALVRRENVVVVLAATHLPDSSGYELARILRTGRPDLVVFLLVGPGEPYDELRARAAGVEGRVDRPVTLDGLRRRLEGVLGPLAGAAEPIPASSLEEVEPMPAELVEAMPMEAMEPVDDPPSLAPEAVLPLPPAEAPPAAPAVADERVATFVPRDDRAWPRVSVDPEVVGPAMERAILEVLPVVVEKVLDQALHRSQAFRDLLEAAVDEAVRAQIDAVARRVIRERLAEIEAAGDDAG